jgi:hypothetical protein
MRPRSLALPVLVAFVLSACQGPQDAPADAVALTSEQVNQSDGATQGAPLMGVWQRIGTYCGSSFAAGGTQDYLVITGAAIVRHTTTACGPKTAWRKWSYSLSAAAELTTTREGDFLDCAAQTFAPYPEPGRSAGSGPQGYRLDGDRLEWTVGICGSGQQVELYERRPSL